ncbi:23S rRNA (uracil(1939)-C(5))-methyltransferase RlmD [Granulicella sp. dw_53]|uniref:23S rRNA (uracil(1939)-C(5))-methyltransferase RlmD n=1 Tax=Granulicella sp. dw_53 TaxID=2719792 RepID=UPI001BD20D35|nr:23S rRNA (uracil(1939)-C(5))-methyltransferase RlmD [Granulicella sp. dw_53]
MRLQIEKVVYGGAGLAHQAEAGKAVFVPFTLPGEIVEAELSVEKDAYGGAELVRVIEASSDRVAPGCVHFGACGGCQLQHAEYSAQMRMKAGILRESLERVGLVELPEVQSHGDAFWGYRNRIRLRIAEMDGALRLGYNRRGSNEFLPIQECPIAAPLLWRAASALLKLAETDKGAERWLRGAVEIEFFSNGDETKLQMTLFVRGALSADLKGLCERLRVVVPELVGAGVSILAKESALRSRRTERPAAGASWGAEGLLYRAAGADYWVSRGGFFQVNRFLIDTMVRLVTEGREGRLAWDLYAGVGLFSKALAKAFERVVGVEGSETAAADLAGTLKGPRTQAICASTVDFLRHTVIQRERPEVVVMDPPRAGLGADVCELLVRLKAAELVYVSCDPVTLARDLKVLVDGGYALVELHLVDMFPQTFHQETVVVLRRGA